PQLSTTLIYDLSLHDALPISAGQEDPKVEGLSRDQRFFANWATVWRTKYTPENAKVRLATDPHAPAQFRAMGAPANLPTFAAALDRKSTRLNSSHVKISYAVF